MSVVTIDSFTESGAASAYFLSAYSLANYPYRCQSFTCTYGITLASCKFYIRANIPALASGNVYAKLYAHTGTYGTSSLPTGSALATSDAIAISSMSDSNSLVTFTFSGANQVSLSSSTYYVLVMENTSANENDVVGGALNSSGTHSGNGAVYLGSSSAWSVQATSDYPFYIYGSSAVPTVTTQACSSVTHNSATLNGNITSTGGVAVTRRGFCYKEGTSGDPTTSDTTVYDDGTFNTGAYSEAITGLSVVTGYRVRSYCTNADGTSYGTTVQLTTGAGSAPTVTTTTTSKLWKTYVIFGGNVTAQGDTSVTDRGIYWGTTEETQSNQIQDGSGTGEFTTTKTGLTANTPYYYKAYATNTAGTSYGDILSFTTAKDTPTEGEVYCLPPFKH